MEFSVNEFRNYLETLDDDISLFDIKLNINEVDIIKANLERIGEFDLKCQMTIEDFIESVEIGCIGNYDGNGYYGFENSKSKLGVDFNKTFIQYEINKFGFTHVYWYNK